MCIRDRPYAKREDGDRKPSGPRAEGAKPYAPRDAAKPYAKREDGDRKPYAPRAEGAKPYACLLYTSRCV